MKETTRRATVAAILACAGMFTMLSLSAQDTPTQKRPALSQPPPPPLPTNFGRPYVRQNPSPIATFPSVPNLLPPSFDVAPAVAPPKAPYVHPLHAEPPVYPGATVYSALTALKWDAERKEYTSKPGDLTANYTFWFTNTTEKEVIINAVRTSCGCTVAKLPVIPWHVQPGTNGPIDVTLDLRGKVGTITKAVTVETSAGVKSLFVGVTVATPPAVATAPAVAGTLPPNHPPMGDQERLENMQKALADRQVVFKDAKCATCHADPAKGQVDGSVIYRGICATCHDSALRAAAVTDLKALKHETDIDYWKQWISHGKPGSMMPAYALSEGGPLNDHQILALAKYCMSVFQPSAARASQTSTVVTNAAASSPAVTVYPIPTRK